MAKPTDRKRLPVTTCSQIHPINAVEAERHLKGVWSYGLVLFVGLAALVGCGSDSTSTSDNSPNPSSPPGARVYATNFPLTENPISEGGNWITGKTTGMNWSDIRTTPGLAFGTQPGTISFDDSIAILSGTWAPNQTVQATVHRAVGHTGGEVEVLLRFSISNNNAHGYEVNWNVANDGSQYCQIVKWNGGLGNFTILGGGTSSCPGVVNGTVVKASIDATDTIRLYHNGNLIASVTDSNSPWTSGAPGIGTYLPFGSGLTQSNYGLTSVTASD